MDESSAANSPRLVKKKQFLESVKRCITPHGSKQLTEAAAVTCVKLCKASTYINKGDGKSVLLELVQSVSIDLTV